MKQARPKRCQENTNNPAGQDVPMTTARILKSDEEEPSPSPNENHKEAPDHAGKQEPRRGGKSGQAARKSRAKTELSSEKSQEPDSDEQPSEREESESRGNKRKNISGESNEDQEKWPHIRFFQLETRIRREDIYKLIKETQTPFSYIEGIIQKPGNVVNITFDNKQNAIRLADIFQKRPEVKSATAHGDDRTDLTIRWVPIDYPQRHLEEILAKFEIKGPAQLVTQPDVNGGWV